MTQGEKMVFAAVWALMFKKAYDANDIVGGDRESAAIVACEAVKEMRNAPRDIEAIGDREVLEMLHAMLEDES